MNIPFGTVSQLNLTDPDSMKITPFGEILLGDRADGLLVFWPVASPNAPLRVLPLLGTVKVGTPAFPAYVGKLASPVVPSCRW